MNPESYTRKTFIMILGKNSYVCLVGILNVVDLHLGVASQSCELPYFWILVLEYTRVEGIWMRVNITTAFEINCYGKGEDVRDYSVGPEIEPIKKSGSMGVVMDQSCTYLARVSIDDGQLAVVVNV